MTSTTVRPLRDLGDGISSALPEGEDGAPYDRHARIYDRLIGSRRYNRLVWGCDLGEYSAFAAEALASSQGPYLEAACGTAVFTAEGYRAATRPVVLLDRSIEMLRRAGQRLTGTSAALVQGDLFDPPFAPGSFATVACFAALHVLEQPWDALARLRELVGPGSCALRAPAGQGGERGWRVA